MVAQVSHWVPESSLQELFLGRKSFFLISHGPHLLSCKTRVSNFGFTFSEGMLLLS